eukprot:CAMPEP_0114595040 /NCGR_PEP_ID=MMETSP0125-20121206/16771_1 /TAXON_ID=485358 ORGANISM="Aristerostoma sp., Strain ATCC 50986" /NCGR_SAMPLE_ID=MMETSP0125 /ASSEMBLY_ACC=CAM_ASM_000245 /LENGTH=69 /DNA_ID=CAMNT_0001796095 /DNA_START=821 /DNA_END=1030 /DNA_ORIENTATION=+
MFAMKEESKKQVKKSVQKYDHRKKKYFTAVFSKNSNLIYVMDKDGYFTELRIKDSKIDTTSTFADAILQ